MTVSDEPPQADPALRVERLRALVESSSVMVWTTDARGMIEDMPVWRRLTGQTVEEVRGTGWLDALHPDDRERSAAAWWEAHAGKGEYYSEYRLRMADGAYRWFAARAVPLLDDAGEVREWVGTFHDVHERRAAREEEARLVATLERIGGTLTSELDLQRIVQVATDEATALTRARFGAFFYNLVDERGESYTLYTLSGAPRSAFERFPMPRNTAVFAPTFHGEGVVRSDDITRDERYGKSGPYHGMPPGHLPVRSYLAVPVLSRTGEVLGGLFFGHEDTGVFTDRSERVAVGVAGWAAVAIDNARLFEAERRARGEAEQANLAKSQFLASMSHELRTPLNAIGGYVELLEMGIRGPLTEQQTADLDRIRRAQQHLLGLINDVLNFAKLEAGRIEFRVQPVPLGALVADVEALIAPQAAARGIAFWRAAAGGAPRVLADPDKLQQVLLNLLSNAVKFTEGGGTVAVEWEEEGDEVRVRVRDTGCGIAPEKLAAVFEPFVQADPDLTRTRQGTGLGLAISRELARGMGADITAESEVGVGSAFTLHLRRAG